MNFSARHLHRAVGICSLLLACCVSTGGAAGNLPQDEGGKARSRPNILLIVTDDQRAEGTLGVMPQTLQRFGGEGTTFTNAFATTPLCCPSRSSMFTGRYAHNHGVLTNHLAGRLDADTTIQRYLNGAGYRTAIFGKYLSGLDLERDPEHFDEWAVFPSTWGIYRGGSWNVNGKVRSFSGYYLPHMRRMIERFLAGAETADSDPWFMVVSPPAPHRPFTPQERYRDASVPEWVVSEAVNEADRSDKPPYIERLPDEDIGDIRKARTGQLRTLMSVDDLVGQVFEELDALGEDGRTLAVYTSDNGFLWGEHGLFQKGHAYDPSVRIPLMVRWPGRIGGAKRDDRLAGNVDIASTVLDAAGLEPDHAVDGISLLGGEKRDALLLEFEEDLHAPSWAAMRTSSHQYTEYYGKTGRVSFREYYALERDPLQLTNLLDDPDPGVDVQLLHRRLRELRLCAGKSCR